jgi:hypothetical protein
MKQRKVEMRECDFGPMITGLASAMRYDLKPEAADAWYEALKQFSREEISEAFGKLSETCAKMPTPSQAIERIRRIRGWHKQRTGSEKYANTMSASTPFGQACIRNISRILAGEITRDEGRANLAHLIEKHHPNLEDITGRQL